MDDCSIVIVVAAKDSANAAVHILRFDVVINAERQLVLKQREIIQRFPPMIHLTGQVHAWGNSLFGVKEVADTFHGNRLKILVKVELDTAETVCKNRITYQRYSETCVD